MAVADSFKLLNSSADEPGHRLGQLVEMNLAGLNSGKMKRFGNETGQTIRLFVDDSQQFALMRGIGNGRSQQATGRRFYRGQWCLEFVSDSVNKCRFEFLALPCCLGS